jgi:S1-C subfamily serine protease
MLKSRLGYVVASCIAILGLALIVLANTAVAAPPVLGSPSAASQENVFMVKVPTGEQSGGTGFLLNHPDYGKVIVTNRHVCEALDEVNLTHLLEQGVEIHVAFTRAKSDLTDLCLIKPPLEVIGTREGLKLAARDAKPGEGVIVDGHPYLRPLTRYTGRLVNTLVQPYDLEEIPPTKFMRMGRLSFMVFPGNSGSPVLNEAGEVVGVVFAMEGWTRNGLYIPLLDLKYFLMQAGSSL